LGLRGSSGVRSSRSGVGPDPDRGAGGLDPCTGPGPGTGPPPMVDVDSIVAPERAAPAATTVESPATVATSVVAVSAELIGFCRYGVTNALANSSSLCSPTPPGSSDVETMVLTSGRVDVESRTVVSVAAIVVAAASVVDGASVVVVVVVLVVIDVEVVVVVDVEVVVVVDVEVVVVVDVEVVVVVPPMVTTPNMVLAHPPTFAKQLAVGSMAFQLRLKNNRGAIQCSNRLPSGEVWTPIGSCRVPPLRASPSRNQVSIPDVWKFPTVDGIQYREIEGYSGSIVG